MRISPIILPCMLHIVCASIDATAAYIDFNTEYCYGIWYSNIINALTGYFIMLQYARLYVPDRSIFGYLVVYVGINIWSIICISKPCSKNNLLLWYALLFELISRPVLLINYIYFSLYRKPTCQLEGCVLENCQHV